MFIWLIALAARMTRETTLARRLTRDTGLGAGCQLVGPGRRSVDEHEDGVFEGRSIDDDQHAEGDGDSKDCDGTNRARVFRLLQGRVELLSRLWVYGRTSDRKTPVLQ